MTAFRAVWAFTVRELFRAKIIRGLVILLALIAIALPFALHSDDSAIGLFRLQITYVLGAMGLVLSVSALWCGCLLPGSDFRSGRIETLLVKPLPRLIYLSARLLGILTVHAALLVLALGGFVLVLSFGFPDSPQPEGHLVYHPEYPKVQDIEMDVPHCHESDCGHDHGSPLIAQRTARMIRAAEIPSMKGRRWIFPSIPDAGRNFTLRFRMLASPLPMQSTHFDRLKGIWEADSEFSCEFNGRSNYFDHIHIQLDSAVLAHELRFINTDSISYYLHRADGPFLLVDGCGFMENLARTGVVIMLEIALFGIVGILFGAIFSYAAAMICAFGYLALGWLVWLRTAPLPSPFGGLQIDNAGDPLANLLRHLVPAPPAFDCTEKLWNGVMITAGDIGGLCLTEFLLKLLPLAILMIIFWQRREVFPENNA